MRIFSRRVGKSTVLHGAGVINSLLEIISNTKTNYTTDICGNSKFPSKIFSYDSVTKLINTSLRERDVKQRYIFEITKDNVIYCKNLIKMKNDHGNNIDIHHMNDIEANFALNQTEYLGSMTLSEHNQQAMYSNIPEIVEQQHSIFESLWKKSIPAEDILEEIELGIEPEFFEVIADSQKATEIYLNLAKFLQKEGLIIYADSRALNRAQKLGVLDYLIFASSQRSAKIKIICPLDEFNSAIVKQISERAPDIKILNGGNSQSGLFVADEKEFLRFEIKDAKAPDFSQAIGFIVHSNSKSGVSSSKSMFELIWNEHVQYQKIKGFEKQKEANKLKDEFINIAAHELRTPIQPILGLSNVLLSKTIDPGEHDHLLRVIIRNAERLQKLADSILDVTRIESGLLKLRTEKIKIHDLILDVIENYTDQIGNSRNQRIMYESDREDFVVKADRERITQVICNLLNNAVKFSEGINKDGEETKTKTITVATNRLKKEQGDYVTISIKDMGTGIDAQIFPQLFSRFTSKSFSGTGLGLFISKSIVEAHGGEIWAENNPSGKGSTFTFTLPITSQGDIDTI